MSRYDFEDEESRRVDRHRRQLHQFGDRRTPVAYIAEGELMQGEFETSFANAWINVQYGGFSMNPVVYSVSEEGEWVECRVRSEHLYTNNRDMMCLALRLHVHGTDEVIAVVEVHMDGRA